MTRNNKYNEYRSRWRAITFNYEVIEAQEALSGTMHCLSATTRMLLMSMLPYLSWPTRYDGEDMDTDKIMSWFEIATDELGGDMIRQNPANLCQMQMSCDGVTWTTVMDYSRCIAPATPTEASSYDVVIEANGETYDGDMSNLTDKWDYDGTYPSHFTNDALCWAIHEYVRMVCAAQVTQINEKNEDKNFFQDLGGYMALASGVAGVMAAVGVFVVSAATGGAALALGAIILSMAGEYDDEDAALYEDEDTIADIACAILTEMVGTKPTFAAWQTALVGDTSEPVNDYVYDTMQSEDLFMQFLFITADMVVAAETYELECPCPEPPWTAYADCEVPILPDYINVDSGNFVANQGVHGICYTDGSDRTQAGISAIANDPYTQTRVRMHYANLANCGGAPGGSQQAHIRNGENLIEWNFGTVGQGAGFLDNDSVEHVDGIAGESQCQLRSCYFNCGGTLTIVGMTIQGTGYNPYDGASGWVIT